MQLSPLSALNPFGAPTLDGLDTNNIEDGRRIGGTSGRQFVRFYRKKETLFVKAKDGKVTPFETERECVHIKTPGDTNVIDTHAEEYHRREHFRQYQAFRNGHTGPIGMPIDEATFVSQHIATELKIMGCHTVEQLADGSDVLCGQIPNGFELREFARAMMASRKDDKALQQVAALKTELDASQKAMREMQQQMQVMQAMILNSRGEPVGTIEAEPATQEAADIISAEPAKRRGRPRKIDITDGQND